MSKALIAGINQVATDKGLDREVIFEAIEAALISAYKRNYGSVANVTSEVDRVTGDMRVFAEREVVEDVYNLRTEITLEDVHKLYPDAELGDVVKVETQPADFGRIAAQTAKQVILQRIREAERDTVYENFVHRVGEILNAQVRSVDTVSGTVTVFLDDRHECLLMRDEQIPRERLRRGAYIRVYVADVHKSTRGPVIKLSRTHRNLLRRLMEQEIPEVRDGIVEIKAIAREPGARSKAAVSATQPNVDAVGSCVGMRGLRIQNIVNELSGEKIDVVEWSPDLAQYISNALSPAKVNNVLLDDSAAVKTAIVIVPDRQLSLAIGKEGQNARLAAKLTGWRIDIKSESEAMDEDLDRLIQAQMEARAAAAGDLLAVAERLLQDEDQREPVETEDLLSKAARAIEESPETLPSTAEAFGIDLPPLEDLIDAVEEPAPSLPELPDVDDLPEMPSFVEQESKEEEGVSETEAEAALQGEVEVELEAETDSGLEMSTADELPEVITADMLRARMAQRKEIDFDAEDFEIPAELLVGLDEDETEEEPAEEKKKGAKKGKKKRRRPQTAEDDDYSGYF